MAEKIKRPATKPSDVPPRYRRGFLDTMDRRGFVVRTLVQRYGVLTNHLGGEAQLSYQEQSLCKRIVHLERLIEKKELALANGGVTDEGVYLTSITTLSALFSKIGLKRRAKVLTLGDYLKTKPAPQGPQPKESS